MTDLIRVCCSAVAIAMLGIAVAAPTHSAGTRQAELIVADTTCSIAIIGRFRHGQPTIADSSAREVTLARLSGVYLGALHYCMAHGGRLPATAEDLLAYGRATPPLTRCALHADSDLRDEWRTRFRWDRSGATLSIRSAGPDRSFGTADDLVVPPSAGMPADTVSVARACSWRTTDAGSTPAGTPDERAQ